MSIIRTLRTKLEAETSAFNRKMRAARGTVAKFSGAVKGALGAAARIGVVAGTGAAVGLAAFIKSGLNAADSMGKMSARIGISTADLAAFRLAGELAGASVEDVDKSLEKMTRSMGEAAQGVGEAKDALKLLNLDVEDLIGKDAGEQFKLIADRISQLSDQELKAAAAADIFGRSGIKLVNVLDQGRAGLEQAAREAKKFGLAITEIDAAKAEAANDAFTRLGKVFQGLKLQLAVALAPAIQSATDRITEFFTEGEGVEEKAKSLAITLLTVFENIAVGILGAVKSVQELSLAIQRIPGLGPPLTEKQKALAEAQRKALGDPILSGRIQLELDKLDPLKQLQASIDGVAAAQEAIRERFANFKRDVRESNLDKLIDEKIGNPFQEGSESFKKLEEAFRSMFPPNSRVVDGKIGGEIRVLETSKPGEGFEDLDALRIAREQQRIREQLVAEITVAEDRATGFRDAMAIAASHVEQALFNFRGIRDLLKAIVRDLGSAAFRRTVDALLFAESSQGFRPRAADPSVGTVDLATFLGSGLTAEAQIQNQVFIEPGAIVDSGFRARPALARAITTTRPSDNLRDYRARGR